MWVRAKLMDNPLTPQRLSATYPHRTEAPHARYPSRHAPLGVRRLPVDLLLRHQGLPGRVRESSRVDNPAGGAGGVVADVADAVDAVEQRLDRRRVDGQPAGHVAVQRRRRKARRRWRHPGAARNVENLADLAVVLCSEVLLRLPAGGASAVFEHASDAGGGGRCLGVYRWSVLWTRPAAAAGADGVAPRQGHCAALT